jgi:hypothetical protein
MSLGDAPPVRALFQRRIAGDDSLLGLTALRFRQAGMGAELYAETRQDLERLLGFVPESAVLPTVHLDRRIDLLTDDGRDIVARFQQRFAGRVAGFVVHDRPSMSDRLQATADALRDVHRRSPQADAPKVFVEFANGLETDRFVRLAELISDVESVSMCIDVGHVGIRHCRQEISRRLGARGVPAPHDPDLAAGADQIVAAMASALGVVTAMIDSLGVINKSVHFHLHDGQPLTSGLADHLGFLTRVPITFPFRGRYSLPQLFGPSGLTAILRHAQHMTAQPSYTLEIQQVEGRLPLRDARPMFAHWVDLTNAERLNNWLAVLAEHYVLTTALLDEIAAETVVGSDRRSPSGR